jgi:hypothetical protein
VRAYFPFALLPGVAYPDPLAVQTRGYASTAPSIAGADANTPDLNVAFHFYSQMAPKAGTHNFPLTLTFAESPDAAYDNVGVVATNTPGNDSHLISAPAGTTSVVWDGSGIPGGVTGRTIWWGLWERFDSPGNIFWLTETLLWPLKFQ